MARQNEHDWSGSIHNLTIEEEQILWGHAWAGSGSTNIFAEDWETYKYTSDVSPAGILSVLVPSFFMGDAAKVPAGARFMRLNFHTSPTPDCITYTLTNEQEAFFGVPKLYIDANYGPTIYTYDGGWRFNNYGPGYDLQVPYDTKITEDTMPPTAFLLVDSAVGAFLGLNPRKCVDLSVLMQNIAQSLVDAGDDPGAFYTSTEYDGKKFRLDMHNFVGVETSGAVYDYISALESAYEWDELIGIDISTPHTDIIFSDILDYLIANYDTESLTPNYYDYNWRKGDEWQYTAELDKSTKRVTFTLNKLTSGINMDGVGAAEVFKTPSVTLNATHRIYIENDGNKRILTTIKEANTPATATTKAPLYELVSNTKAYKSYVKNSDDTDYEPVEFINHLYVESEIELTVNGTTTKYIYISGLSGQNATPISYAYAVPIDDSDTFSGDNILTNNSGHCGNNFEFRSALYTSKDLVSGDNKESIQELINAMNAIAAHSVDGATFAKETLTINYNGQEGKAPEDDTASLDVGCGGVMYRLGGLLDISNLNRQLWAGANVDWNNLLCLFDNPLDAIYSLMSFPCDFEHSQSAEDVYVGNMLLANTSEMTAYRVTTRHAKIEFDFYPHGYYENFLDYAPYTGIQLHVPYYGLVDLPVDKVLDHDCKLIYYVDCNTGMARVQVKVYWKNSSTGSTKTGRAVVWESDIKIGVDIPLSSTNFNAKLVGMLEGIGTTALTAGLALAPGATTVGNVAGTAVSCLQNAMSENKISKSGSFTGNTSMLADRSVYLIYSRPIWSNNAQFNHDFGRKLNDRRSLGSVSGFTKTYNVDTSSIPATKAEQDMIKSYLDNGVYL